MPLPPWYPWTQALARAQDWERTGELARQPFRQRINGKRVKEQSQSRRHVCTWDEGRGKATVSDPGRWPERLTAGPCQSFSTLYKARPHPWEAWPRTKPGADPRKPQCHTGIKKVTPLIPSTKIYENVNMCQTPCQEILMIYIVSAIKQFKLMRKADNTWCKVAQGTIVTTQKFWPNQAQVQDEERGEEWRQDGERSRKSSLRKNPFINVKSEQDGSRVICWSHSITWLYF